MPAVACAREHLLHQGQHAGLVVHHEHARAGERHVKRAGNGRRRHDQLMRVPACSLAFLLQTQALLPGVELLRTKQAIKILFDPWL